MVDRGLARVLRGQRIGAVGEQQRQLDRAADRAGADVADPGHDRERNPTIDLLKSAPDVELKVLFSPEHGLRGVQDEHSRASESSTSIGPS